MIARGMAERRGPMTVEVTARLANFDDTQMRERTLRDHLSLTEDALRNERSRIADQLELIRKLRSDGRNPSAAKELLQSMNSNLCTLERHRELLLEQLGLFVPSPSPIHLGRHTRRNAD
jgi:hypothetical protein